MQLRNQHVKEMCTDIPRNTRSFYLHVYAIKNWTYPPISQSFLSDDYEGLFWGPWVNFINVFTHSFYTCRSQKLKKLLELTVFFALLGSALVKLLVK